MATKCFPVLRGRRMRLTRLDGCGRPVYAADSVIVTKGFISVALTADIDDGEAITVQNANGDNCINEPAVPKLNGYGVAITFCSVEPDALAITSGQRPYLDYTGDSAGFTVDTSVSMTDTAFALELWMGSPSADACTPGATGSYGYMLLPFVQGGVLGDFTVENAAINFAITNAATKTGGSWGVGPYNVVNNTTPAPAPLPRALSTTEPFLLVQTTLAPPEPFCGAQPLLNPTGTALTSIAATPSASRNVSIAATPSNSEPWYVDFGNGVTRYNATGAAITYQYPTGTTGSKTVTAYRGTSVKTATFTIVP